jgi:hypothetical protein
MTFETDSQAADRTSILTLRPARAAKISRASSENSLILPCSKSLRRGCVMPSWRAARAYVVFQPCSFSLMALMTLECIVIVAASSGLSSMDSHRSHARVRV